jgi:hypothetical protein
MYDSTTSQLETCLWVLFANCCIVLLVFGRRLFGQSSADCDLLENTLLLTNDLRHKVDLLREQSDGYFSTLQEAGFRELGELDEYLAAVTEALTEMYKSGHRPARREVRELCTWLRKPTAPPPKTRFLRQDLVESVQDWRGRSSAIIINCAQGLEATHQRELQYGVKRHGQKRRDTLTTIRELMRDLEH